MPGFNYSKVPFTTWLLDLMCSEMERENERERERERERARSSYIINPCLSETSADQRMRGRKKAKKRNKLHFNFVHGMQFCHLTKGGYDINARYKKYSGNKMSVKSEVRVDLQYLQLQ